MTGPGRDQTDPLGKRLLGVAFLHLDETKPLSIRAASSSESAQVEDLALHPAVEADRHLALVKQGWSAT